MNEWRRRCSCLAEGREAETFFAFFSKNPAIFPCSREDLILFFGPAHTETVIFMAVRIHCNVVQEEEEVTGRHSVRGGGGSGLVSGVLCSSVETYLHKSEAWIGMASREDLAKDYLGDVR